ncbi:bifunctional DNA primase/polymerase [Patescibacteria group bacterium]|nr:bifunctional DNA primase/polymerase [Patescibacteria group bacterium]
MIQMLVNKRLQERGNRFIRLQKPRIIKVEGQKDIIEGKKAIDKGWQKDNNYPFDHEKIQKHEGNVGFKTGHGIVVVDCDSPEMLEHALVKLPRSFTVKTSTTPDGFQKKQMYFKSDMTEKMIIENKEGKHLGEVQALGQYVVCPPSVHPSGTPYEVFDDVDFAYVSKEEMQSVFEGLIKGQTDYTLGGAKGFRKSRNTEETDRICKEIKEKISIEDVMKEYGFLMTKNPTKCLWHDSQGEQSFSYNRETGIWHCFSCGLGGSIFDLVMKHENVDFLTAKDKLRKKAGIEDNLRIRVLNLLANRKRDEATELIVQEFMKDNHVYSTRDDEKPEMWIYREGIFVPSAKTYIESFCDEILTVVYKNTLISQIIDKVRVRTYIEPNDFFDEKHKEFVAVDNGLLHLKERKLYPFDPEKIFFSKLPIVFNPSAKCPNIESFFECVLPMSNDIKTIYEIFGFLLYDNYFVEKAVMFYGSGRNGKSKTFELIKHFIGMDNCVELTLTALENDGFSLGELFKKKVNLAGDISSTAIKNSGNFKKLVGRDLISAQRKFKNRVTFQNYAKLLFSANELPITYDITPAFWNRWVLIDFPYYFLSKEQMEDKEEIEKIPEDKRNKVKLADPNIIDKLITHEELSGLLNLALQGLQRLFDNGDFTQGKNSSKIQRMWTMRSDSCLAFTTLHCEESYDDYLTKKEFLQKYHQFCRTHKLKIATDLRIKAILQTNFGVSEARMTLDNTTTRIWEGIKFKTA